MLHIVKLIERHFPERSTRIIRTLFLLSLAALTLGIVQLLR